MSFFQDHWPLRRALLIDAVVSGVTGVVMVAGAAPLSGLLLLPEPLLRTVGLLFMPFVAFVTFVATRPQPPRAAVWAVIAMNVIWTIDCIALLLSGWVAPNLLGYGFVLFQAVAVAVFAQLQYLALRGSNPQPAV
ncbi:MAG: hypothetical protein OHK0022_05970 [Roseiflexaceae bacterium]